MSTIDDNEIKQIDGIRDQIESITAERRAAKRPRNRYPKKYIEGQADRLNRWLDTQKLALEAGEKNIIWQKSYLLETGLTYDLMRRWAEINHSYQKATERMKLLQEVALCTEGARKGSNQPFIIFALKNCCGWRDGRETQPAKVAGKTYTDDVD